MEPPKEIKHIVHQLSILPGITRWYVLNDNEKKYIMNNEDVNNEGVKESVKRQYCICLIHDSAWREPTQTIVKKENGEIIFPPVVFPEVPAKNVVSSSPGIAIHTWLAQKVRIEKEEATLLIGFNLV
ncbi:MAG: hypothetical protein V1776_05440 [Candidatus Diapherotrites archaeon]